MFVLNLQYMQGFPTSWTEVILEINSSECGEAYSGIFILKRRASALGRVNTLVRFDIIEHC